MNEITKVTSRIYKNVIKLETEMYNSHNIIRHKIATKTIDLEEKAIQEALISLGWTPPKKEKYYVLCNNKKEYCSSIRKCWKLIGEQPFGSLHEIRYSDSNELVTSEIPY